MKKNWLKSFISGIVDEIQRGIKDVEAWDGAASNYDSTDAYCAACLIDVNDAAGRDTKAQSHCMLPVRGPGDSKSTYVRQAVHGAAGGHGITQVKKPDDVSQEDWDAAIKKAAAEIDKAYQMMDEETPDSVMKLMSIKKDLAVTFQGIADAAWKMIYEHDTGDEYAWLNDIYAEDSGVFLVVAAAGKLYRVPVTLDAESNISFGDWEQVYIDFAPQTPMPEEQVPAMSAQSRTQIFRAGGTDENPVYRWLSVSCVATLNRSGEIDTTKLFDSFIEHAERTGEYPIRQFYHLGDEWRTGQCDFLAREGFTLVSSGVYDNTPLAMAEILARQADPDYWGDSIGFYPDGFEMVGDGEGVQVPMYTRGRCVEISTLPENEAASWFTNATTVAALEVENMNARQKAALAKLLNIKESEVDAWLAANPGAINNAITQSGMIALSRKDTPAQPAPVVQPVEVDEELVELISRNVAQALEDRIGEFVAAIAALDTRMDEIESALNSRSQDDTNAFAEVSRRLQMLEEVEDEAQANRTVDLPPSPIRVTYRPRRGTVENQADAGSSAIAEQTLAQLPGNY